MVRFARSYYEFTVSQERYHEAKELLDIFVVLNILDMIFCFDHMQASSSRLLGAYILRGEAKLFLLQLENFEGQKNRIKHTRFKPPNFCQHRFLWSLW